MSAGTHSMRGRHGHHARGARNGRWNGGRMRTAEGYIAVRVPDGHHLRLAHGYAYEHQIVAERMLGRRLRANEVAHHRNHCRGDNRPENLQVMTVRAHAALHCADSLRDALGRFARREQQERAA